MDKNGQEKKGERLHAIPCDLCGSSRFTPLFQKSSSREELFLIQQCTGCGLVQVNPQPDEEAVKPYYSATYFQQRTDRGYNDYFSEATRDAICRVYEMNLHDLDFYPFETTLLSSGTATALDAGCAAGYFVDYLIRRGWNARGIEISADAARFGIETLSLPIHIGDFFSDDSLAPASFDLITLWASIEHMHSPRNVLARSYELLKPGGRLILSTCRYGLLARMRKEKWRYMNVPEHLYFFSVANMKGYARRAGFSVFRQISYGSGLTAKKGAGWPYRMLKQIADPAMKLLNQGDMMALHLIK